MVFNLNSLLVVVGAFFVLHYGDEEGVIFVAYLNISFIFVYIHSFTSILTYTFVSLRLYAIMHYIADELLGRLTNA